MIEKQTWIDLQVELLHRLWQCPPFWEVQVQVLEVEAVEIYTKTIVLQIVPEDSIQYQCRFDMKFNASNQCILPYMPFMIWSNSSRINFYLNKFENTSSVLKVGPWNFYVHILTHILWAFLTKKKSQGLVRRRHSKKVNDLKILKVQCALGIFRENEIQCYWCQKKWRSETWRYISETTTKKFEKNCWTNIYEQFNAQCVVWMNPWCVSWICSLFSHHKFQRQNMEYEIIRPLTTLLREIRNLLTYIDIPTIGFLLWFLVWN